MGFTFQTNFQTNGIIQIIVYQDVTRLLHSCYIVVT